MGTRRRSTPPGDNHWISGVQPAPEVWRDFGLNMQRSAANRPWMPCIGNHEAELDNGPNGYNSYTTRFKLPSNGTAFPGSFYSFQVGSVLSSASMPTTSAIRAPAHTTSASWPPPMREATRFPPPTTCTTSTTRAASRPEPATAPFLRAGPRPTCRRNGWSRHWPRRAPVPRSTGSSSRCTSPLSVVDHDNGCDAGIRQAWVPLFDQYQVDLVSTATTTTTSAPTRCGDSHRPRIPAVDLEGVRRTPLAQRLRLQHQRADVVTPNNGAIVNTFTPVVASGEGTGTCPAPSTRHWEPCTWFWEGVGPTSATTRTTVGRPTSPPSPRSAWDRLRRHCGRDQAPAGRQRALRLVGQQGHGDAYGIALFASTPECRAATRRSRDLLPHADPDERPARRTASSTPFTCPGRGATTRRPERPSSRCRRTRWGSRRRGCRRAARPAASSGEEVRAGGRAGRPPRTGGGLPHPQAGRAGRAARPEYLTILPGSETPPRRRSPTSARPRPSPRRRCSPSRTLVWADSPTPLHRHGSRRGGWRAGGPGIRPDRERYRGHGERHHRRPHLRRGPLHRA